MSNDEATGARDQSAQETLVAKPSRSIMDMSSGDSLSVKLLAENAKKERLWQKSFHRMVFFEVKNKDGETAPRAIDHIFLGESAEKAPFADSTSPTLVLKKKRENEYLIQMEDNFYSGVKLDRPGSYLLTFHVVCIGKNYRPIYHGRTEEVVLKISDRIPFHGTDKNHVVMPVTSEAR